MPSIPPSSVNRQAVQTSLEQMGNIKNKDESLRIKLTNGKTSVLSGSAQGRFKGFAINKQTVIKKTINQQLDLVAFINTACKEAKLPVHLDCRSISATEGMAILSAVLDKHQENDRQATVTSTLEEAASHKKSGQYVADIVNKENDISFLTQLREDVANAAIYDDDAVDAIDARIQALSPSSIDNNEKDRRADVTSTLEKAASYSRVSKDVADIVNKEDDLSFLTQLREDVANASVYDDVLDVIDARIKTLSSSSLDATQSSIEADIAEEVKLENRKLASEIFNDLETITQEQVIPNQEILKMTSARNKKFRYITDPKIAKVPVETALKLPTSGDEEVQRFHGNVVQLHPNEPISIATQAPKPNAQGDFWLANFNNDAKAIVDLTQAQDLASKKVHIYYPTGSETLTFESGGETLQVSLKEQSIHPENSDIQRCEYLVVDSNGNEKLIDRVHYTGWVDHQGVEAQVLNQLIDTVDHVAGKDGVITVHCSAGVGRTGTFITARTAKHQLADKAMDSAQIKKEIVDLGTQGRIQRNRAFIQKPEQMLTLVEFFQDLSKAAPADTSQATKSIYQNVGDLAKTPQTEEPIYQNVGDLAKTPATEEPIYQNVGDLAKTPATEEPIYQNIGDLAKTPATEEPIYQNIGDLAKTSQATAESIDQITPQPSSPPPRPMSVARFWKRYDQHSTTSSTPKKIWTNVANDLKKVAPSQHEKILNEFEAITPGAKSYLKQLLSNK